jgi:hypothetical protein
MARLVVTFLGVLLGALFAYKIDRRLAQSTLSEEKLREDQRDHEYLSAHLERTKSEVRYNRLAIPRVIEVLTKAKEAVPAGDKQNALSFAAKLARGFSVVAYDSLASSGLQRLLPSEIQDELFNARHRTMEMRVMVEASEFALPYYGLGADIGSHIGEVLDYCYVTLRVLGRMQEQEWFWR